jgi:cyanophycinase
MSGNGYLLIIGGAEDKHGKRSILSQAADMVRKDEILTIITTATNYPEEVGQEYKDVFYKLGVDHINILNIDTRDDANSEDTCEVIRESKCIFFTGGDQLRITSILGGTKANSELQYLYRDGGFIMGTSAGASAMSSTMIVQGNDNEPARKCTLKMAPGLGLIENCIIDQHFDQRGRFGRLLCGIAENPNVIGIGIDENTAIKVYPDIHFEVIGENSVTVIDGSTIQSSNVAELEPNELLAIVGVSVHILPYGYGYDLVTKEVIKLER